MGRLLVLVTKKRLDMQHILQYWLTPAAMSMAGLDEAIAKTDKGALFRILEDKVKGDREARSSLCLYQMDSSCCTAC